MKQSNKQNGFSAVEIALALLVVALLAFGGWYIWQKNNDTDKQSNNTTGQNNGDSPDQDEQEPVDSNDDQYLEVKEWGVRFALPENLQGDISYAVNTKVQEDVGGPVRIDLTSAKFSAGNLKCAVVEDNSPRVIVSFFKEVDGEGGETQDPQPFNRIGSTRYYFTTTGCEEAITREGSADDKALLAALKDAVKNTLETSVAR